MSKWLSLTGADGTEFRAWHVRATPQEGRAPFGLVMLPEVYNLNPWARSAAQRFADAGAEVLLLDLYWRDGVDLHFNYDTPEPARALGAAVRTSEVLADVAVAGQVLRRRLGADACIAALGYCLGGRLALLARNVANVDAAISYYGVNLEAHMTEIAADNSPALLHFGSADPWVPQATIAQLQEIALSPTASLRVQVHAGADHGFARSGYPPWHAEADRRAHLASLDFLRSLRC